ncbi:MAG: DUF932 domain-containing protein [Rhodocyclaceae bacterium]|nr:DUF932 domain-containing protein [Rhodocyclaceae bacterium]
MSQYLQTELNAGVVTGFLSEKIRAWHQAGVPVDQLRAEGRAFDGPVPPEVAEQLVGWKPITFKPGKLTMEHFDDEGNPQFVDVILPERLGQLVVNPYSMQLVNVAGLGYEPELHIAMQKAIELATDAEVDIASVVCLGHGAHMAMSFRARDGVVLGGIAGGMVPYVGYSTSLASFLATSLHTGTTLQVCDNTMHKAAAEAVAKVKVKRTRFSADVLTAERLRSALDISFKETEALAAELERLANVEVTDAQLAAVLKKWKPFPEDGKPGRKMTLAKNAHAEFRKELWGARNPFGQTVAGLIQTNNTYQHWHTGGAKGVGRLERMHQRTIMGDVQKDDLSFVTLMRELELV